ncbi:MAG TPA: type ISP restriction/modification enzyme [Pyrinomonadaceae bacterium]|nr:type ISP restriction/modification enzyme [Pyrinomonadaceae bacterium]
MTLAQNVPPRFKNAIYAFATSLKTNFSSLMAANPEDQLKGPVQALLGSVAPRVQTRTEAQVQELGARPDIGVTVRRLLCGHVELKAPGKGARVSRFKGADKAQWEKFKALPNLLYTDGSEWALYRSGELESELVRFNGDVTTEGIAAIHDDDIANLHTLLLDFLSWRPIAPSSPQALAKVLAPLCRLLREDVLTAVSNPESNLAQLANEWRAYLFPDADDARFADAYAQTLTYALLLARLNGEANLTTESAAATLDSGHGLLAQALRVLSQPEAREEISTAVDLLERLIGAVEPVKLEKRGDPWLYFYEDFLSIYDPKLRKDYGVYYTPVDVIRAQVRLVSQLLEEKFGKNLSYADEGVVFLDPGAGTAAYPLGAIHHALEIVSDRFGEGMVAARASDCANNFHAFEILVGPYAVAHLRLTQVISDYGGSLPADGIRVFLTDTLESPHANPPQPNLFARKLTEEHRRAQYVKNHTKVLVCMGNPPYDREQREVDADPANQRKGGWIRFGDPSEPEQQPILQDFIEPASQAGAGVHVKNLYNDYVYFWRWALWKLFENPQANGPGIVSFITASSYLRGPGFVGMRQKMRESFDELWIIDLEGDNLGARKTENVFAIRTPVAIAIGVRYGEPQPESPATVRYSKITGSREEKLERLARVHTFSDLEWQECFKEWMRPFLPQGAGDYYSWPVLTDLFPWQHSGAQFKRTWPIGENREVLEARWRELLRLTGADRGELFRESRDRKVDRTYRALDRGQQRLTSIGSLDSDSPMVVAQRYAHRSFDRKWALADARLGDFLRPALWLTQGEHQVFLTSLLADVLGLGPAAIVCSLVPDLHHFSGRGGKDIVPLYRDAEAIHPNITGDLLTTLSAALGEGVSIEDFFAYCYAMLASPAYVEEFSEELTVPGPRIPITKDDELFRRVSAFGRKLIWLHTFGERFVPNNARPGEVPQGSARSIRGVPTDPEHYPNEFSFESAQQILRVGEGEFGPVTDEVWNFSISGFAVLHSWLGYRMKSGAGRSSSPLDEIRPDRWTAAMSQELLEILWVLEATTNLFPELRELFNSVIQSPTFTAEELPQPSREEHQAPEEEEDESPQISLEM